MGSWLCQKAQREPTTPKVKQEVMPGHVLLSQVLDSLPGLCVLSSAALGFSGNLNCAGKLQGQVHLCLRRSSQGPGER